MVEEEPKRIAPCSEKPRLVQVQVPSYSALVTTTAAMQIPFGV